MYCSEDVYNRVLRIRGELFELATKGNEGQRAILNNANDILGTFTLFYEVKE